jgi:ubiquinone biosynthesis protein
MANALTQTFRNVGRLSQIVNVFARYGFRTEIQASDLAKYIEPDAAELSTEEVVRTPSGSHTVQNPKSYRAKRLRQALEELGPTFVKLGQLLASREDILPKHFLFEFRKLRDNAKPFEVGIVKQVIEKELRRSFSQIVQEFDDVPLGSASIGQVHRAMLPTGEWVVFKVQRPGIEALIQTDLSLLGSLAALLEAALEEMRAMRISNVIEELHRSLYLELDYLREASNTQRAGNFFKDSETIYIPRVYKEYSTKRLLCLEVIEGQKLSNGTIPHDKSHLVKMGLQAFLDMTFKFGTFHADLHAGNFLLLSNQKLAILDFGLTARLTKENRLTLSFLLLSLVNEDIDTFCRLFLDFTEIEETMDTSSLVRDLRNLLEDTLAIAPQDIQLGKLFMQTARICAKHKVPVSRDLVLFFRALIALESFAKALDPEFDAIHQANEYSKTLASKGLMKQLFSEQEKLLWMRDAQAIARDLPLGIRTWIKQLKRGVFHWQVASPDLRILAREIDRASNRLSLALLLGAIVLSSSLLTFNKSGPLFDSLSILGIGGFGIAMILGIWLVISILRSGGYK